MPVTPGNPITATQMLALQNLANAAPGLAGKPYNFTTGWLTELNRLRANLPTMAGYNGHVSGPWPAQSLSTIFGSIYYIDGELNYGTLSSANEVSFYFADTPAAGLTRRVSLVQFSGVQSHDPALLGTFPPYGSTLNVKIKIGGTRPVRFQGAFLFLCATELAGGISGSVETDFPGASFAPGPVHGFPGETQKFESAPIDAVIAPGEYYFRANITGGQFQYPFILVGNCPGISIKNYWVKLSTAADGPVVTPGIHTSLEVFKINASIVTSGLGFGIHSLNRFGQWFTSGTVYESDIAGLWLAKTTMIGTLPDLKAWMPWNPLVETGELRGTPTGTPHEDRTQPAEGVLITRANSTAVTAGNYIRGGSAYHYALHNGTTGSSVPPTWPAKAGAAVNDGGVVWKCMGANLPATARKFSLTAYPNYKEGDPAHLKPQRYDFWPFFSDPFFQPYFWIYRIRLNRLRVITDDQREMEAVDLPDPIEVRLGCWRNGSFHQFGVYQTGEWIEAMWPIFTQDALVYQAAERVDIQASLCPTSPVFSPTIGYPILAAHYNDTEALLNLLINPPDL